VKGGYKIDKIIPVDQFLWSSHVETVALLSKK
jgi:23S rRNA (uracil1939-C5)-methyltransferase